MPARKFFMKIEKKVILLRLTEHRLVLLWINFWPNQIKFPIFQLAVTHLLRIRSKIISRSLLQLFIRKIVAMACYNERQFAASDVERERYLIKRH